jgi:5-carboxymethyl-2-hydroxymuconate isomerase
MARNKLRKVLPVPHIVCHYARDQKMPPVREVLSMLHRAAAATGVVKAEDLKSRAQAFDDYWIAGARKSFFHVSFYLLAGRTPEQKERLSIALRQGLVEMMPEVHSISIDIRDMDSDAYKKRLLPD